ncbi:MAG: hypothetical protein ACREWI_05210 [Telluria sp.]
MKKLIIVTASLAVLAGCAAPGPNYYGSRPYAQPGASGEWQVVSVTPVPLGTGARAAAAGDTGTTTYSSAPVYVQQQPVYGSQPIYGPQPVYAPQPVYQPRYYYPPISIGLGFNFGRGWGHHHGGWGASIGTRFPYHYRR